MGMRMQDAGVGIPEEAGPEGDRSAGRRPDRRRGFDADRCPARSAWSGFLRLGRWSGIRRSDRVPGGFAGRSSGPIFPAGTVASPSSGPDPAVNRGRIRFGLTRPWRDWPGGIAAGWAGRIGAVVASAIRAGPIGPGRPASGHPDPTCGVAVRPSRPAANGAVSRSDQMGRAGQREGCLTSVDIHYVPFSRLFAFPFRVPCRAARRLLRERVVE